MNTKIFFVLIVFLTIGFFCGCTKYKFKNQACGSQLRILTENYNTDSVYIYVPNAFTPNGDGINDLFNIIGKGFKESQMKITKNFSLIFESSDINNYWDGKNSKGNMQKAGIYNYYFKILTIHDEEVEIEGEVSLLEYKDNYIEYDIENCESCLFSDMIHPKYGAMYPTREFIKCK